MSEATAKPIRPGIAAIKSAVPLAIVEGDEVQLQQVILNLVMNAIESMQSAQYRVLRIQSNLDKPEMVHVSIEDTGAGIDASNVDHIFKPLFTTKARGMGMGLSICHSIIESHDGRIWVTPGANGGARFQFELRCHFAPGSESALVARSRRATNSPQRAELGD